MQLYPRRIVRIIPLLLALVSCQSVPEAVSQVDKAKSAAELGNQYARDGLLREAIASYRSALAMNPVDQAARRNLGLVLVKIGDYRSAVVELEDALKSFDTDFDTNFFLGEAYRGLEKYAEAIFQYQKAIKIRADDVKALKALSWSYFNIRFYSEALSTARKLNQIAPNDLQASIIVARTFLKLQRPKDAFKILKSAKQKADKENMPYILAVEGNIRLELGQIERAQAAFREAIKDQPFLATGLLGLGRCHLQKKEYDKAISYLETAARVKPRNKEVFYYLGQAFETVDTKKSIRYYQTFSKLAATDPEYVGMINTVRERAQALKLRTPTTNERQAL